MVLARTPACMHGLSQGGARDHEREPRCSHTDSGRMEQWRQARMRDRGTPGQVGDAKIGIEAEDLVKVPDGGFVVAQLRCGYTEVEEDAF